MDARPAPSQSRPPGRVQTVGQALVGLLEAHGTTAVFGIPGVHTLELYRGLAESAIRHVTPRHEQGAGFMADGYARVQADGPGVCFVISGGGVTNILTPIAQAHHDSQPMLVISAEPDQSDRGHGSLHELPDQVAITRPICAFSATADEPEALPEMLRDAYAVFAGPRPRPVHISVPTNVLQAVAPSMEPIPVVVPKREPVRAEVAAAAQILARASRPLILLGGGGVDAGSETLALAELLEAPMLTTGNAKGAVADSHPLSLGCAIPTDAVLAELAASDVVIAIGTELSSVEALSIGRPIEINGVVVRIDVDPGQLADDRFATVAVLADARLGLVMLADALQQVERVDPAPGAERAQRLRAELRWWPDVDVQRPFLNAIAAAITPDTIVALDSTQLAYSALNCLTRPTACPRGWLAPNGYGTLGPALPMAIGAKVANPQRPVVAIAGDGGALFTIAELATAARHGLPIVLLIWDNQGYREIADAMKRASIPPIGTDLGSVDFVNLGRALGCDAELIESPDALGPAMTRGLRSGRPSLLHIAAPTGGPLDHR